MKPVLLLILYLGLGSIPAGTQTVRFSDTTNWWNVINCHYDPGLYVTGWSAGYVGDTIVKGIRYHRLQDGNSLYPLAIREDAQNGRIYFRFLTKAWGWGYPTDSLEHLFFDYNLKVNDTLKVNYGKYRSVHYVSVMSTVMIGGGYYRTWSMRSAPIVSAYYGEAIGNRPYTFVEGIGPMDHPTYSTFAVNFEDWQKLLCFYTNNWRPGIYPSVEGFFDNDTSCRFNPLQVDGFTSAQVLVVSPNPGGRESVLKVPLTLRQSLLSITDAAGRIIASESFHNVKEIALGEFLSTPGMYYYTLQDAATGERYTGRFIFQ